MVSPSCIEPHVHPSHGPIILNTDGSSYDPWCMFEVCGSTGVVAQYGAMKYLRLLQYEGRPLEEHSSLCSMSV